jgi:hypothetical protein
MTNERLIQIREESESWKRLLDFIQSENTTIKTRIAAIAAGAIDRDVLEKAEGFQAQCIRKDELVMTLKKDINDFNKWLSRIRIDNTTLFNTALILQRELRSNIKTLSQRFHQLKFNFHDFVAENF